jgi:hypothetical protein
MRDKGDLRTRGPRPKKTKKNHSVVAEKNRVAKMPVEIATNDSRCKACGKLPLAVTKSLQPIL